MDDHIFISHVVDLPKEPFEEFITLLRQDNLKIHIKSRPMPGPQMGVEWLVSTAVLVYLTKPYFESFLKEAGKDHYNLLKEGIAKLGARLLRKNVQMMPVHSTGNVKSSPRYSLMFSVIAELKNGLTLKLLIDVEASVEIVATATEVFLNFVRAFHQGNLQHDILVDIENAQPLGKMLLVAFNSNTGKLELIDPVPKHVRDKQAQA